MRSTKAWFLGSLLFATIAGSALLSTSTTGWAQPAQERSYWRHHEGRWSHWDSRDQRWYYTDGKHWFYNGGNKGWHLYRFDKTFGREGFQRGGYQVPGPNVEVVVPNHGIYVAPR